MGRRREKMEKQRTGRRRREKMEKLRTGRRRENMEK